MAINYASSVNPQTKRDAYPIPLVQDLLDQASQWSWFSKVDLSAAYHQIPLEPSERQYTAFEANGRLYEFTHVPFGLTNAPACFQRELQKILDPLDGVLHYFDDIVIGGKSKDEHDKCLHAFLDTAEKVGMSLRSDKCVFGGRRLTWLGHVIENGTRRPDPDRLNGFLKYPTPSTVESLRRFIGVAVYHSQWIPRFSEIMEPLFEAMNYRRLPLSSACVKAIDHIKKSVSEAVLLVPVPGKELRLETDASGSSVGAILSQEGRPVAYMSRRLSQSEKRWSPAELEGYAVVLAVRKFKSFLCGKFTIITDQQGLVSALKSKSAVKNAKYARWRLELADFDYKVQYRPGILNVAADALSRCSAINLQESLNLLEVEKVRRIHRELGHPGIDRLYHFIKDSEIIVHHLYEVCRTVCTQCRICAEIKPRWLRPSSPGHLIEAKGPWERISIDFKEPKPVARDGKRWFLTVVDEFSRFPFAIATKDRSSETVISCLKPLFSLFGPPQSVHSDRGKEFLSESFLSFLKEWGIRKTTTTPYNPRGNGQCEKFNDIIWKTVTCFLMERRLQQEDWPLVLPDALSAIRSLKCKSTGSTPHELFLQFRRIFPIPLKQDSILKPGEKALLRQMVRTKDEPLGEEVKIIEVYPQYAVIQMKNKQSTDTCNIRHLSKLPQEINSDSSLAQTCLEVQKTKTTKTHPQLDILSERPTEVPEPHSVSNSNDVLQETQHVQAQSEYAADSRGQYITRSGRQVIPPNRFGYSET